MSYQEKGLKKQMISIHNIINPSQADLDLISNGICHEAYKKKGLPKLESFCFLLKDNNLKTIGGIHGIIYYGCLYTDELWIDEQYRAQGYGMALMEKAEELAVAKGCKFATVNTMDFEAKPFYEKLGYRVEFERNGYINSHILYHLRKEL